RVRPEPAARPRRRARVRAGRAARSQARPRLLHDLVLRARRPEERFARLRPAAPGGRRPDLRHRRAGRRRRPRRRLADRPRDRDVRGVRDPRGADGGRRPHPRRLALGDGAVPSPQGTAFHAIAPYQVFPTADGGLMITAANDGLFRRLAEAIGLPELADDPRFATNPDRVRNRPALAEALSARLREDTRAAWLEKLAAARVPAAPVQDIGEVAADPQLEAVGILQRLGPFTTLGPAFSVDGERPQYASPPPALGQHSAEILAEAGYTGAEISAMAAEGIIRTA